MSFLDTDMEGYYCRATWSDGTVVKSDQATVDILGLEVNQQQCFTIKKTEIMNLC